MAELSTSEASAVVVVGDRVTAQTVWRQAAALGLLPAGGDVAWLWLDAGNAGNATAAGGKKKGNVPVGMLSLRPVPLQADKHAVRASVRVFAECVKDAMAARCEGWTTKVTRVTDACRTVLEGDEFPVDLYR